MFLSKQKYSQLCHCFFTRMGRKTRKPFPLLNSVGFRETENKKQFPVSNLKASWICYSAGDTAVLLYSLLQFSSLTSWTWFCIFSIEQGTSIFSQHIYICECVRSIINFHSGNQDVDLDMFEMFFNFQCTKFGPSQVTSKMGFSKRAITCTIEISHKLIPWDIIDITRIIVSETYLTN